MKCSISSEYSPFVLALGDGDNVDHILPGPIVPGHCITIYVDQYPRGHMMVHVGSVEHSVAGFQMQHLYIEKKLVNIDCGCYNERMD